MSELLICTRKHISLACYIPNDPDPLLSETTPHTPRGHFFSLAQDPAPLLPCSLMDWSQRSLPPHDMGSEALVGLWAACTAFHTQLLGPGSIIRQQRSIKRWLPGWGMFPSLIGSPVPQGALEQLSEFHFSKYSVSGSFQARTSSDFHLPPASEQLAQNSSGCKRLLETCCQLLGRVSTEKDICLLYPQETRAMAQPRN